MFINEQLLYKFGKQYNVKVSNVFPNSFIIISKWDEWLVEWYFGDYMRVKHRNTRNDTNQFHKQQDKHLNTKYLKFSIKKPEELFKYIKQHDLYMDKYKDKTMKVHNIFKKIER